MSNCPHIPHPYLPSHATHATSVPTVCARQRWQLSQTVMTWQHFNLSAGLVIPTPSLFLSFSLSLSLSLSLSFSLLLSSLFSTYSFSQENHHQWLSHPIFSTTNVFKTDALHSFSVALFFFSFFSSVFFFKLDHSCGEECAVTNVKGNQKTKITSPKFEKLCWCCVIVWVHTPPASSYSAAFFPRFLFRS